MSRNLATAAPPSSDNVVARLEAVGVQPANGDGLAPGVTFAVRAETLLFLVGPAGAGKTAILDLLSFHALPRRGRVEVLGVDPARLAPSRRPRMRRRVGVMFQQPCLLTDLDLFANVALPARVAGRGVRDFAPRVGELLVWVGLGGRGSESVSRLTEGEKRRLCLARALINGPELLVADDPTAGLGHKAERSLLRLIAEVRAAGTPVVFATRDPSLAAHVGGTVVELPASAVAPAA